MATRILRAITATTLAIISFTAMVMVGMTDISIPDWAILMLLIAAPSAFLGALAVARTDTTE